MLVYKMLKIVTILIMDIEINCLRLRSTVPSSFLFSLQESKGTRVREKKFNCLEYLYFYYQYINRNKDKQKNLVNLF